jgi:diaminohydroxyphosphoribosylaminopyrimidine deaminase/5-amino-6-(5-phosphoribosylamino)uracil reductase
LDGSDLHFMQLALQEARKGVGRTSPNPAVGAVVVQNGIVVGKGYHKRAGLPHAEPNALRAAGKRAQGATIYVTLEPCNHSGRTPPCTEAILAAGIKRVVIGMGDPNPWVTGRGAEYLIGHGVAVTRGVLEEQCREINLPFVKHSTTGLPWVIMKAGLSLDGRIAAASGQRTPITGAQSRRQVHRLRDRVDAILIGVETALIDNPSLTTRLSDRRHGRDPERIILDTNLRLSPVATMLQQESAAGTRIFCGPHAAAANRRVLEQAGARVTQVGITADQGLDLRAVLTALGNSQINSVLVEGGGRVHGSFLRQGLVDEVYLFMAPIFFGAAGVPVVDFAGRATGVLPTIKYMQTRRLGDDIMIRGRIGSTDPTK